MSVSERETRLEAALRAIYDDARHRFDGDHGFPGTEFVAGQCRWCNAPPPEADHDHDVACPAAKAAYALDLPPPSSPMPGTDYILADGPLAGVSVRVQDHVVALTVPSGGSYVRGGDGFRWTPDA